MIFHSPVSKRKPMTQGVVPLVVPDNSSNNGLPQVTNNVNIYENTILNQTNNNKSVNPFHIPPNNPFSFKNNSELGFPGTNTNFNAGNKMDGEKYDVQGVPNPYYQKIEIEDETHGLNSFFVPNQFNNSNCRLNKINLQTGNNIDPQFLKNSNINTSFTEIAHVESNKGIFSNINNNNNGNIFQNNNLPKDMSISLDAGKKTGVEFYVNTEGKLLQVKSGEKKDNKMVRQRAVEIDFNIKIKDPELLKGKEIPAFMDIKSLTDKIYYFIIDFIC